MKMHILQHVDFEGAGVIENWAKAAHIQVTRTQFWLNAKLPDPKTIDAVVVMGGPMSCYDEAAISWMTPEKAFLKEAIASGKRVLGVCLGSQLLAEVLGGRVYPGPEKEIGWYPAQGIGPGMELFGAEFTPLHWHGDTFDLPPGAELLASSRAYANQAFRVGKRVLALQFHLEVTPADVRNLLAHCEPPPDHPFVQPTSEILDKPERFHAANSLLVNLLNEFFLV